MISPDSRRFGPRARTGHLRSLLSIIGATGIRSLVPVAIMTGALAGPAAAQNAFTMRSTSPFPGLISLPARWPDAEPRSFELSWNIASHSISQQSGNESLFMDGETHTLMARAQRSFGSRIRAGIEVPWIAQSGGFMDSMIDSWHGWFGLPEGIRPSIPRNDLKFVYLVDDQEVYRLDQRAAGLGDIRLSLSYDLIEYEHAAITLVGGIKLPTGDGSKLTGSGSADYSTGLRVSSPPARSERYSWWLDFGIVRPGAVDIPGLQESQQILYYDLALAWKAFSAVSLLAQVSGYYAPYESSIKALGQAGMQLGLGADWQISKRYSLRFGIFEDIKVETAPDFGLELALGVRY